MANGSDGPVPVFNSTQLGNVKGDPWVSPGGIQDGASPGDHDVFLHLSADSSGDATWRICTIAEADEGETCAYISEDDWGTIGDGTLSSNGRRIDVSGTDYAVSAASAGEDCMIFAKVTQQ